ncbi:MAG: HAD family hydrolase [Oscillospiraceae bacterium]|nr:HAD family hydrolase [Oscillospiraceae bacterium]
MRYEAILLDMDGTVLDTLEDLADSMNAALRHFGMPEIRLDQARAYVGNGSARYVELAVPAGTPEALRQEVLDWYKPWYDAHCRIKTRPYAGIPELLRALRAAGLRLCIISNKPDASVQKLTQEHFAGLLDLAVGESAQLRRKPWPDMIEAAAARLGLDKARCLYVGDSEVDVQTARNASIDCASVSWGFRSAEELQAAGAAMLFDSPQTLRDWILES